MKFVRYVSQDNVLRDFGQRVRDHRLARNLSQDEVAFQAGVRICTLAAFEAGRRSVDLTAFVRICLALGLKDRIPEWVPAVPESALGRTLYRGGVRRRAGKRADPIPDPDEDPEAYWSHVRWVWEP